MERFEEFESEDGCWKFEGRREVTLEHELLEVWDKVMTITKPDQTTVDAIGMDNHHLLNVGRCWACRPTMPERDYEAKLAECACVEMCSSPDFDLVQGLVFVTLDNTLGAENGRVATLAAAVYCGFGCFAYRTFAAGIFFSFEEHERFLEFVEVGKEGFDLRVCRLLESLQKTLLVQLKMNGEKILTF